ncbi:MAG: carboxylesterase family protein, partial [Duodenibacillus sp.]|nr:carboxylesterase family protein [Duodenibacillus sp.]
MKHNLATGLTAAFLAVSSCFALPAAAADASPAAAPVRATAQGPVSGVLEEGGRAQAYLGVPYAAAPVGALRWKAPQPPAARQGVLEAAKAPAMALQMSKGQAKGSDDCLYLNIWRPNTDAGNLPVMVFLHGGNNQTGASTAASYGKALAANAGMIVVGLNYRLGPLGFVQLPALKSGDALESSGNFTLLDINAALDWVRANIAGFGGDPGNITIAGHSAGGRDVMAILTSPLFKGKFQKAMSLSGGQTV